MWQQGPIEDDSCHAGSRPRASKERAGMSTRATKRGRSGARKRTRGGGRAPAKRRAPARRAGGGLWLRVPGLGQRELDLIGLGLVAVGLFLGSVMYLGWAGGQVGGALTDAVRYLVGVVAYGVPVALVVGGAVVVVRPLLPEERPVGGGAAGLLAARTLALAAGTLGLGPHGARTGVWDPTFVQPRGGVVGEAVYTVAAGAAQQAGAHILALFLFCAALLLLTGATIAGVVRAVRSGVGGTVRQARELRAGFASPGALAPLAGPRRESPLLPPGGTAGELGGRARHGAAPPNDTPGRRLGDARLAPGTKVSKVAQLRDDIAYALAASEIRILAPIPGKQAVGVEVPNRHRRMVHLGDVFQDPPADWSPLTVWLGKDVPGRAIGADLTKMPHLLVAGTTGSGKSGCINAMLASILLRATPHEVRLVLVDPKQVELTHYESIPHLLTPVITSPRMAANALGNLVREMEQRYGLMSLARTRSLPELNRARAKRGEPPLPYVLCVIDELADLMMVAPADVEDSIIRLAQKARAVGIHLVLATQSPRVDVITGMIKANVPSRIASAVSSQTDSRVILDHNGAESLLGQGAMPFGPVGASKLQRIQGAYIDEPQIAEVTDAWRRQGEPEFHEELLEEVESSEAGSSGEEEFHPDEDPLLEEAIALVAQMGTASTSMLQRRLRLGYTRAGRLIDMLERRGI